MRKLFPLNIEYRLPQEFVLIEWNYQQDLRKYHTFNLKLLGPNRHNSFYVSQKSKATNKRDPHSYIQMKTSFETKLKPNSDLPRCFPGI